MPSVARWLPLIALLVAAPAAAAPQAAAPPAKETVFWQGQAAGWTVRWSNRDLTIVRPNARPMYSARQDSFEHSRDLETGCEDDDVVRMLSVVGPLVSLGEAHAGNCPGTAHPFAFRDFRTLDLSRGGRPADLRDWYPADTLRRVLLGDRLIQRALKELDAPTPATLDALLKTIDGAPSPECAYNLNADMLKDFAFHHVKGHQVAVRIGLPHGCEAARGNLAQLGLYLPIPKALAEPLALAASGRQGFLMSQAPAGETAFSYGEPHDSWVPGFRF